MDECVAVAVAEAAAVAEAVAVPVAVCTMHISPVCTMHISPVCAMPLLVLNGLFEKFLKNNTLFPEGRVFRILHAFTSPGSPPGATVSEKRYPVFQMLDFTSFYEPGQPSGGNSF